MNFTSNQVYTLIPVNQDITQEEETTHVFLIDYETIALDQKNLTALKLGEISLQLTLLNVTDTKEIICLIENLNQVMTQGNMKITILQCWEANQVKT